MPNKERKYLDCRDYPSESNCSLKIAGTEDEVLEAAAAHAVAVHGHEDTPTFRQELRSMMKRDED
jgi:predicted small metal-binding protein